MSEARKCDRCHGYFELSAEDQKNHDLPYYMKGTYVKIMLFGRYGEVENSVRWFDLCPNCIELLDKWLENPDIDDTDCADRSNGATEKEIELASKLNDANIYIAQLKSELGYTLTKEEIEMVGDNPKYKDPCKTCNDGVCEQCIYGYISEEEKKKRWLENHKKEEEK